MRRAASTRLRCIHAGATLLGALALAAATAPAAALAQPATDQTLVVASIPDPSSPPGTGNVVQAFDSSSQTELGQPGGVPVGSNPYALAITPDGSTAFAVNNLSGTVTPVNLPSLGTQASLCLPAGNCSGGGDPGTQPEAIALTPDGSAAWAANSAENSISQISINNGTAKVVSPQISSTAFSEPDAIAITPDGKTAWVANFGNGTVVAVSIPSGRIGTPVSVGNSPTGLAITPDGQELIVANSGDGTVSDVSLTSLSVNTFSLEPTATGFVSPHAVAISPDGSTAYVTDTAGSAVVPVAISTDTPRDPVGVGNEPVSIAVSADGSTAYVADELSDDVTVLNLAGSSPSFEGSIATNGSPDAVALTPDQAPIASFTIAPGTAGSDTSFDASASTTVPAGGLLTYTWDFGDGSAPSTTSSSTTTHTYANPGTYKVTLTVTDAAGTSTAVVFTGQTASRNGGPSATTNQTFQVQGATSGAAPEAVVAGNGGGTATPVALRSGSSPSATPGLPTGVGGSPSAVAINPTGTTAYVVDTGSNQVTPVDMTTGQAESTARWIGVGSEPNAIAITPDGRFAYVVNGGSTSLSKITLSTGSVSTINVPAAAGADLDAIAITPDGSKAYVLDAANNTITPIALSTGTAGSPVGGSGLLSPDAIAIAPNGKTAYVVDGGSATQPGGITTVDITGTSPAPQSTTTLDSSADHPDAIAISPAGSTAYIVDAPTNGHTATVVAVSLSGTSVTKHTPVAVPNATALYGIAATPDSASAFATGTTSNGSAVIVPIATSGAIATPAAPADLSSQPGGIAIAPDQAPVAQLSVASPDAAGAPVTFDASASSNPSSRIASYTFNFGDGSSPVTVNAPTASASHSYAVAGTYTATVTVTDAAGTSTTQVFTGQTMSRNGSSDAVASQSVTIYPTVTSVSPASGAGGTKVTINGTGFSTTAGRTKVAFGSTSSTSVTCGSTVKCVATAPAGTGTIDITVTVGGQTSPASAADQFTYGATGGPGPFVSSISPTSGPPGTVVTLVGSGFSTKQGTTIVSFGSKRSPSVVCGSTTRCRASAPKGVTGTVYITVTVNGQVSPALSSDRYTYRAYVL
jgi:DNA-binding beta-propeller fold protein YncE